MQNLDIPVILAFGTETMFHFLLCICTRYTRCTNFLISIV